jgi:hypothetical protein
MMMEHQSEQTHKDDNLEHKQLVPISVGNTQRRYQNV